MLMLIYELCVLTVSSSAGIVVAELMTKAPRGTGNLLQDTSESLHIVADLIHIYESANRMEQLKVPEKTYPVFNSEALLPRLALITIMMTS